MASEAQIVTFIPYADDRNLGRACNECMALLSEDGWGVLLDHDAVFTTPEWHRQLTAAITQYPEGCFTVKTNRARYPYKVRAIGQNNHDMAYHRQVGKEMLANQTLTDVTDEREPNGMCIILSKQAWREVGGFAEGMHYVDRLMWMALKLTGRRIYLVEGVYMYHWHRGDGAPIQQGEWARRHTLADGRTILVGSESELPVYDGTVKGQAK